MSLAKFLAGGLMIGVASAAVAGVPMIPVTRCGDDTVAAGTVCLEGTRRLCGRPALSGRFRCAGPPPNQPTRLQQIGAVEALGESGEQLGEPGTDPCARRRQTHASIVV